MSNLGKLNWSDVGRGILTAFLAAFIGGLYEGLSAGTFPSTKQIGSYALLGVAAGLGHLLQILGTNSENKLLKKETEHK